MSIVNSNYVFIMVFYLINIIVTIVITKGSIIKIIPRGLRALTVQPTPILFSTNIEESSGL